MKQKYDEPVLQVYALPIEHGFAMSGEHDGIENTYWEPEEENPFA